MSKKEISICRNNVQIENPLPFCQERVRLFFQSVSLPSGLVSLSQNQDRPELHFASKRLTLSFTLSPFYPLLHRRITVGSMFSAAVQVFILGYWFYIFQIVIVLHAQKAALNIPHVTARCYLFSIIFHSICYTISVKHIPVFFFFINYPIHIRL